MNKAEEIIKKYSLVPNSYYPDGVNPYDFRTGKHTDMDNHIAEQNDLYKKYSQKWKDYVPEKWYGWGGLGNPTPVSWYLAIDEFLEYVKEIDPEFKILQLKIKFGSLRMYLNSTKQEVHELCHILEESMFDEKLIY